MIQEHAYDSVHARRLFSAQLEAPRLDPGALPDGNFACLLAWDAEGATTDEIASFADCLLRAGASYFVCWGPDCERVHDIIDEIVSLPESGYDVPPDSCIMTTWHDGEPLTEAIWFFLVNSWPDDHFADSTNAGVAVSIGSAEWAAEISSALSDPSGFVRRTAERDAAEARAAPDAPARPAVG
jgi:hypothetical protein